MLKSTLVLLSISLFYIPITCPIAVYHCSSAVYHYRRLAGVSSCGTLLCAYLHLNTGDVGIDVWTNIVNPYQSPPLCVHSRQRWYSVWAIQVSLIATVVPPASLINIGTNTTIPVIIIIKSAELHSIGEDHSIPSLPRPSTNGQSILVLWSSHIEGLVGPGLGRPSLSPHIDPQLQVISGSEAVDVLQTQPELTRETAKPIFIVLPISGKDFGPSRKSSLDDYPSSSISLQVTRHILFGWSVECAGATDITDFENSILLRRHKVTNLVGVLLYQYHVHK